VALNVVVGPALHGHLRVQDEQVLAGDVGDVVEVLL